MKNKKNTDYTLYLCTDRDLMSTETIEEAVEQAILGGCTMIQLREKKCSSKDFYETACNVKKITDKYQVPFIINDRVDIALAVDADGVHVGQSDLPADIVRNLLGNGKIMGVSARTVKEAEQAQKDGADYIGVGAIYATNTKKDTKPVTMEELRKIREKVTMPIVVIGGINKDRVKDFEGVGVNGLAVVSSVIAQKDIKKAAVELKEEFFKIQSNTLL